MNQTSAKVELTIVVGLPCSWRFTVILDLAGNCLLDPFLHRNVIS